MMTSKEKSRCAVIIHSASAMTGVIGGGLAQIPCGDAVFIAPCQMAMVVNLGRVFGKSLSESEALAIDASGIGSTVGKAVSKAIVSRIPGFGNVVNATIAVAITENLGWLAASQFADERDAALA